MLDAQLLLGGQPLRHIFGHAIDADPLAIGIQFHLRDAAHVAHLPVVGTQNAISGAELLPVHTALDHLLHHQLPVFGHHHGNRALRGDVPIGRHTVNDKHALGPVNPIPHRVEAPIAHPGHALCVLEQLARVQQVLYGLLEHPAVVVRCLCWRGLGTGQHPVVLHSIPQGRLLFAVT